LLPSVSSRVIAESAGRLDYVRPHAEPHAEHCSVGCELETKTLDIARDALLTAHPAGLVVTVCAILWTPLLRQFRQPNLEVAGQPPNVLRRDVRIESVDAADSDGEWYLGAK